MKWRNSALVIAISATLAIVVVALFWTAHQKDTKLIENHLVLQTGAGEIERTLINSRLKMEGMPSTVDSNLQAAINEDLDETIKLLNKMLNGGSTLYGVFDLDQSDPLSLEINPLIKETRKAQNQLSQLQWVSARPPQPAEPIIDTSFADSMTFIDSGPDPALVAYDAKVSSNVSKNEEVADLLDGAASMMKQFYASLEIRRIEHITRITQSRLLFAILLLVITLGAGFLLYWIHRDLLGGFRILESQRTEETRTLELNAAFAEKIGRGELDTTFAPEESDVLGHALLNMRDNLSKVAEDDTRRNWATEGLAKFADILRGNSEDLAELSYEIISNLVQYVNANQGGLFILDSDSDSTDESLESKFLQLEACYAYERRKYKERQINIGEGLLGQCVLEQETIYMTDIPNDYVAITSGLGEATPRSLLIVPLMVNEEIYGVIEIASFRSFQDHEVQFVEKLAESIASTISGVRINVRTARLLGESQKMTEEMRAQEEEMRQNMEELQATQEEMARKDVELTGQLNGINSTLASVEYDLDGSIQSVNTIFKKTMGYDVEDELTGLTSKVFFKDEYVTSGSYDHLWESLGKGEIKNAIFECRGKNGKTIWLNATYTPILDINGRPYKVMQFAIDVTSQKAQEAQIKLQLDEMKAQEEEMRQNMEEMHSIQTELEAQKKEVEKIREEEKKRSEGQITAQKKIMEQYIAKTKEKELKLKERIAELEKAQLTEK